MCVCVCVCVCVCHKFSLFNEFVCVCRTLETSLVKFESGIKRSLEILYSDIKLRSGVRDPDCYFATKRRAVEQQDSNSETATGHVPQRDDIAAANSEQQDRSDVASVQPQDNSAMAGADEASVQPQDDGAVASAQQQDNSAATNVQRQDEITAEAETNNSALEGSSDGTCENDVRVANSTEDDDNPNVDPGMMPQPCVGDEAFAASMFASDDQHALGAGGGWAGPFTPGPFASWM